MKRPGALVLVVAMFLLAGCTKATTGVLSATSPSPLTNPRVASSSATGSGEWAALACGSYHTLALHRDGTLWAWGLNDYGQLGRGAMDLAAHPVPVRVGHAHAWSAICCGWGSSFALKKDGSLWAWGNDSDWGGNLGTGVRTINDTTFTVDRWSPTRVGRAHDWARLYCGWEHAFAATREGVLWGWGVNFFGALGTGDTNAPVRPVRVGTSRDWAVVAGGGDFSLLIRKDGTLWACGSNIYGNLGLGDTTDRHGPTQVGSGHDWAAASAGSGYSLALKQDGTLWAWGDDSFGELGLGDTAERHVPTQVGSARDWEAACCLGHHSLALRKDGTLWAWGENGFGQLGLGDTADRHVPTQVGEDADWAVIAPGAADSYHTLAMKQGGSLWAWGLNRFGQLGLGDTTDRHIPTEVGAR